MSLEISGKLLQILPEQSGEGKNGTWRKQEFVIETGDQYPKKICMNVWGDRINFLSSLSVGDSIKVGFDVESREYNGKWYTDVKAWKIESSNISGEQNNSKEEIDPFPSDMMNTSANGDNDLPF